MEEEFKNITMRATVNLAIFYNHFFDKHELLEKVLIEDVLKYGCHY